MIEDKPDKKLKIDTLYFLGLAPVLAWPLCILGSVMSARGRDASEESLFYTIGLSFLYPLVPIAWIFLSLIASRRGHPRLAYAAAWAPLIFYILALVLWEIINRLT